MSVTRLAGLAVAVCLACQPILSAQKGKGKPSEPKGTWVANLTIHPDVAGSVPARVLGDDFGSHYQDYRDVSDPPDAGDALAGCFEAEVFGNGPVALRFDRWIGDPSERCSALGGFGRSYTMIIDNPDACSHFQLDFSLGYCELTTPVSPDVSGGLPRLWIENLYPKSNKVPATTFVSFHFHWPDLTPPFDTVGEYYRVFMDQDPAVEVVGNDTRIVRYDGGARVERYNDGLGFDFPLSFEFEIERVLVY